MAECETAPFQAPCFLGTSAPGGKPPIAGPSRPACGRSAGAPSKTAYASARNEVSASTAPSCSFRLPLLPLCDNRRLRPVRPFRRRLHPARRRTWRPCALPLPLGLQKFRFALWAVLLLTHGACGPSSSASSVSAARPVPAPGLATLLPAILPELPRFPA